MEKQQPKYNKRNKGVRKNPETFGRTKKFGYPIDINGLENIGGQGSQARSGMLPQTQGGNTFLNSLQEAMLRICIENGNPRSHLIDEEEAEINAQIKTETLQWLEEALKRLPPNQNVCIYHRFNLSKRSPNTKVQTTKKVGEIVGVSQQTAHYNIKRGLANLKKDFKKNLLPVIKRLKS